MFSTFSQDYLVYISDREILTQLTPFSKLLWSAKSVALEPDIGASNVKERISGMKRKDPGVIQGGIR